jgi:hypothetical protein
MVDRREQARATISAPHSTAGLVEERTLVVAQRKGELYKSVKQYKDDKESTQPRRWLSIFESISR